MNIYIYIFDGVGVKRDLLFFKVMVKEVIYTYARTHVHSFFWLCKWGGWMFVCGWRRRGFYAGLR
jgi:hypothetical protein